MCLLTDLNLMQEEIKKYFSLLTKATTNENVQFITAKIKLLSEANGYCSNLILLFFQPDISQNFAKQLLTELKRMIRAYWQGLQVQPLIPENDKQFILQNILEVNFSAKRFPSLLKIVKDIVYLIGKQTSKIWKTLKIQLAQNCKNQLCLNFMLGVADSFFNTKQNKMRVFCEKFLKQLVPLLEQNLNSYFQKIEDDSYLVLSLFEYLYLAFKFLSKASRLLLPKAQRDMVGSWIKFALGILNSNFRVAQIQINQSQNQQVYKQLYYLQHCQKWILKFITYFIDNNLVKNEDDFRNIELQNFYKDNFQALKNVMLQILIKPTTKKLRFFQLKTLLILARTAGALLQPYFKLIAQEILQKYIQLSKQDYEESRSDAVTFIMKDEDKRYNEQQNLRKISIVIWEYLSLFDEKKSLLMFIDIIEKYLTGDDENLQEVALHLLINLRSEINLKITALAKIQNLIPHIIKCAMNTDSNIIVCGKSMQVLNLYRSLLDEQVCKQLVIYINQIFNHQLTPEYIKIKALLSYQMVLMSQELRSTLALKQIQVNLSAILNAIEKYELDSFVSFLNNYISFYLDHLGPYIRDLAQKIGQMFSKYLEIDTFQLQSNQIKYNKHPFEIAAGTLRSLASLVSSQYFGEIKDILESSIRQILIQLFSTGRQDECYEYMDNAMYLLSRYLHCQRAQIPYTLWFFFTALMFKIVGLPKNYKPVIDQLNVSQKQKKILVGYILSFDDEYVAYKNVLRNYIKKMDSSEPIIKTYEEMKQNIFTCTTMEIFFYYISQLPRCYNQTIYWSSLEMKKSKVFGTLCLISLFENHGAELDRTVFIKTFQQIEQDSKNQRLKSELQKYHCQLLCLMIWTQDRIVLEYLDSLEDKAEQFLVHYFALDKDEFEEIRHFQQSQRIVLGLTNLAFYIQPREYIINNIQFIFRNLFQMALKSASKSYLEEDSQDSYSQNFDNDEHWEIMLNESDEEYYISNLQKVDQLQFMFDAMIDYRNEKPELYEKIVLKKFNEKIKKILKRSGYEENKVYRQLTEQKQFKYFNY